MGGPIVRDVRREIGSLCAVENQSGVDQMRVVMGVVIDLDPLQVLYVGSVPWDVEISLGTLPVGTLVFPSDEAFKNFFMLDETDPVWDVIKAVREVARYFSKK